jgi:hypothetical protein
MATPIPERGSLSLSGYIVLNGWPRLSRFGLSWRVPITAGMAIVGGIRRGACMEAPKGSSLSESGELNLCGPMAWVLVTWDIGGDGADRGLPMIGLSSPSLSRADAGQLIPRCQRRCRSAMARLRRRLQTNTAPTMNARIRNATTAKTPPTVALLSKNDAFL